MEVLPLLWYPFCCGAYVSQCRFHCSTVLDDHRSVMVTLHFSRTERSTCICGGQRLWPAEQQTEGNVFQGTDSIIISYIDKILTSAENLWAGCHGWTTGVQPNKMVQKVGATRPPPQWNHNSVQQSMKRHPIQSGWEASPLKPRVSPL